MRLAVWAYSPRIHRGVLHDERIAAVQQRSEPFEQCGQFLVFQQPCRDDELARPAGNQAGIGLDQLLNLRFGGGSIVRLIRDFRSHVTSSVPIVLDGRVSSVRRLFDETLP